MTQDLERFRRKLAEASAELAQAAQFAEQVDEHTGAARKKIGEARVELEKLVDEVTK